MPLSRWYPTVETLETGDAIIIGGEVGSAIILFEALADLSPFCPFLFHSQLYGSFVNTPEGLQNVPTYEFWPTRGDPVQTDFLVRVSGALHLFSLGSNSRRIELTTSYFCS